MRKLLFLFFIFSIKGLYAQQLSVKGYLLDTVAKAPLQHAVVMAIRMKDSVLMANTRTDKNGAFQLSNLKIDTIRVLITAPGFGEQNFYVFGSTSNNSFDFGKIILPPKTQDLKEVIIYAYKDPVYFKGDTLIYTADSFKVKPNATVEDLLRRLPGITVDANGKIKSQGKEVSQVLVDGDEFFGADPTVATKNLIAKGVESVQVYEKKNENAADGDDQTIKVMNLQMKEDAKKGYFGKVSGATDFTKFYEGEFLANKFKGSRKISVFSLTSNTPRSSFGWNDMYKYGLENDYEWNEDEDYWSNRNQNTGIPQTIKSGFYFSDKIAKKTKLNVNYTFNKSQLIAASETRSQYFLSQNSYISEYASKNNQQSQSHTINFAINQKLDSLTEIDIKPKLIVNENTMESNTSNLIKTTENVLTRDNQISNTSKAKGIDFTGVARLERKFKKKDRLLIANYTFNQKEDDADGYLDSKNLFTDVRFKNDTINQKKVNASGKKSHNARFTYTEPITKKIKFEVEYQFNSNMNNQSKDSYNFLNGTYAKKDSIYSNSFENLTAFNRLSLKYIYETKKRRIIVGSKGQDSRLTNQNLISNSDIKYGSTNLLPFVGYMYKLNTNARYNFNYSTNTGLPTVAQLQPLRDNINPNKIVLGNSSLKPSYSHKFRTSYNSYKPISGKSIWASANWEIVNNAFGSASNYDNVGRNVSQTINVSGNQSGNADVQGTIPLFAKLISISPSLSGRYNANTNYINAQKNRTQSSNVSAGTYFRFDKDSFQFSIGGDYNFNHTVSTLNAASNREYSSQSYTASVTWILPYKFLLESDAQYNVNSQRTAGYNINYLLWNATITKSFFKNENLLVSFNANDILKKNISTNRSVQDNVISDSKTNVITRYFLLRVTYKFNSTHTKDEDEF